MSYNILTIPHFDKELKRLSKKYHSLKLEIVELGKLLESNPQIGSEILSHCYKIRLSIASKG